MQELGHVMVMIAQYLDAMLTVGLLQKHILVVVRERYMRTDTILPFPLSFFQSCLCMEWGSTMQGWILQIARLLRLCLLLETFLCCVSHRQL